MKTKPSNATAFNESCKKIKLLLFDCDGVLTDGKIILASNAIEIKHFSTTDGMGIKIWHKSGFLAGAITGRASEALEKRAEELSFDELHQNIARKGDIFTQIIEKRKLKPEEVAYIGDDINDLPVGVKAGIFFVPANHHPIIRPYADYVLKSKGGEGVIREVVDILLEKKGLMNSIIDEFMTY